MDKESENNHCNSVHYPGMGPLLCTGLSLLSRDYLWPKWSASTFSICSSVSCAFVRIAVWSSKAKHSDLIGLLFPGKHIKSLLLFAAFFFSPSAKWMSCTEHSNWISWKLQTALRIRRPVRGIVFRANWAWKTSHSCSHYTHCSQ